MRLKLFLSGALTVVQEARTPLRPVSILRISSSSTSKIIIQNQLDGKSQFTGVYYMTLNKVLTKEQCKL